MITEIAEKQVKRRGRRRRLEEEVGKKRVWGRSWGKSRIQRECWNSIRDIHEPHMHVRTVRRGRVSNIPFTVELRNVTNHTAVPPQACKLFPRCAPPQPLSRNFPRGSPFPSRAPAYWTKQIQRLLRIRQSRCSHPANSEFPGSRYESRKSARWSDGVAGSWVAFLDKTFILQKATFENILPKNYTITLNSLHAINPVLLFIPWFDRFS